MSEHKLYTVNVTDLVAYTASVVATDEKEAVSIAKAMLWENFEPVEGLTITGRDTEGQAALSDTQPSKTFAVQVTFQSIYEAKLPANDNEEACRHFKRIMGDDGMERFEFNQLEDRAIGYRAREVAA